MLRAEPDFAFVVDQRRKIGRLDRTRAPWRASTSGKEVYDTRRLTTNLLLIPLGYPPAIIRESERTRYIDHLRQGRSWRPGPLDEFSAQAFLDTPMCLIVPGVGGPARLEPLTAL
jgi:hypothetical protein